MLRSLRQRVKRTIRGNQETASRPQHHGNARLLFEPLEPRMLLNAGPLVISEFMAINNNGRFDADLDRPDWIEIYNPSSEAVLLDGWHLTDEASRLNKWEFPNDSGSLLVRTIALSAPRLQT